MSDPYTSIWCNYTENSTNVANNTSNITVSLVCSSSGWADDSPNYWLKVNGSTVRSGTYNFGNGTFTLCSWTGDVPHNADGTGTVTYQGYFQGTAKPNPGNTTGVYSQTLTTISRASTLDNGTTARRIDQNMTFTVTKKIDAATNKLTVRHRTSTGLSTVNTNYTSGGNISFNATTLTSIMALNTTGTSVSMQVVLETIYSNSTVGTSSAYFNGTFAAPAPTWTPGLTVSPTQNVVANHNTITIKCANAPSFKAGTSLSNVKYTIGSKSASSTNYSSAVTFTGVSTNTVTVKITDKRNATYTTSINNAFGILDYVEPTFNITSIGRYPNAENTGAQIQFAGTKVSYQAATVSGYYTNIATGVSTTISSGYITTSGAGTGSTSFTGTVTIPAGAFAIENVYSINLSVSDGYETKSASGSISKVSVLMDLDLNNNRVGIGQLVPLATSGSGSVPSNSLIVAGEIYEEGVSLADKYAGYEVISNTPSGATNVGKYVQLQDASDVNLYPTSDYNNSVNIPSINGVPLIGNKTIEEIIDSTDGIKLLWENPNPTATFAAQTISLSENVSDYDCFLVSYGADNGNYYLQTSIVWLGKQSQLYYMTWGGARYQRAVTINATSIVFANSTSNNSTSNGTNIPFRVYAVSFNVLSGSSGQGSGIKTLWSAPAAASRPDIGSTTTYTLSDTADFYIIKSNYNKQETNNYTYTTVFDNKKTSAAVVGENGQWMEVRSYLISGTNFTVYPAYANKGGGTPQADPAYCYPIDVYGVYLRPTTVNQFNYSLPSINNSNLVDLIYPVGSIYASTSSANPGTIVGGTWTALSRTNYATKQWPTVTTQVASGSNATTTLQITTNGSPIFLLFTGDVNGNDNGSSWAYVRIYRGSTSGTIVAQHLMQTAGGASTNETFSIGCIDVVSAGTYTYTFYIGGGSGKFQLCEASTSVSCMGFEIGADPSIYKWRRTS